MLIVSVNVIGTTCQREVMVVSDDLMTRSEVAAYLGVSLSRIRALMTEGRLAGRLLGGRWVIERAAVRALTLGPRGRPKGIPMVATRPVLPPQRTSVPAAPVVVQPPVFRPTLRATTAVDDVVYERDDSAQVPADW